MSSSVTSRVAVTSWSPIFSSASDLRNGWTPSFRASAPSIQRPVTAESRRGRALDGGALHVVLDAADAAHLLAAAGAAGAAVDEDRQRRAVAGGGLGAQAVADQHAAVERGEAEDGLLGDRLVVGEDRGDEAALAAPGERDGLVEVVVGHDGGDRAEGLDVVDGGRRQRRAAEEDDRVQEGAASRRRRRRRARRRGRRRRSRPPARARGCARAPPCAGRGWRAGPCGRLVRRVAEGGLRRGGRRGRRRARR